MSLTAVVFEAWGPPVAMAALISSLYILQHRQYRRAGSTGGRPGTAGRWSAPRVAAEPSETSCGQLPALLPAVRCAGPMAPAPDPLTAHELTHL
jgi:hypothetical protein